MSIFDKFDQEILRSLQKDGRLTNSELAEAVGLSPSQCSRRRQRLEEEGIIRGYQAVIDPQKAGYSLISIISVTLARHSDNNAEQFRRLLNDIPNIQQAHALTGEMDYSIKVVTSDLAELSNLINTILLPHKSVQNVKTAIVLDTMKDTMALPI